MAGQHIPNQKYLAEVADTAFWGAIFRAEENARPDALVRDPFAARIVAGRGEELSRRMGRATRAIGWSVPVRAAVFDEYIAWAIRRGVDTVVNIGAGFDCRPYRLDLPPSLRWIEIDFAANLDFKAARLEGVTPRCRLRRIALDLTDRGARARVFDEINAGSGKLLVITEGVLNYFFAEDLRSLAADLFDQSNVAYWITDYFSSAFLASAQRGWLRRVLMRVDPSATARKWDLFSARDWEAIEVRHLSDEARRRNRPAPTVWWKNLLRRGLSARRRAQLDAMVAYAMLTPKR